MAMVNAEEHATEAAALFLGVTGRYNVAYFET
jgi:hypothetical protein